MMMYSVSEETILKTWALETIIKKTKNGFDFILMQKGVEQKETCDNMQTEILETIHDESEALYEE